MQADAIWSAIDNLLEAGAKRLDEFEHDSDYLEFRLGYLVERLNVAAVRAMQVAKVAMTRDASVHANLVGQIARACLDNARADLGPTADMVIGDLAQAVETFAQRMDNLPAIAA